MLRFRLLFWVGLSLLLIGCSTAEKETSDGEEVPWATASFVEPLLTELTFTNATTTSREIGVDLRWYRVYIGENLPDSLRPGESVSVEVELHHPRNLFYASGDQQSIRLVLPGRSRHLVHEENGVVEKGAFVKEYTFLDEALMPLNIPGRKPVSINDLEEFRLKEERAARSHFDTLVFPENLPNYIRPFLERIADLRGYQLALQMRSYHKFFYKDTLAVPGGMVDSITSILQRPGYYQTLAYTELQEALSMYKGELRASTYKSSAAINHAALTAGYLNDYPILSRRNDAVAERLIYDICKPRIYSGKMENIDTLRTLLPQAYLKKIDEIERHIIASTASKNGLANFLNTPYATPSGKEQSVMALADKPLRLLKFWFAGCYPCLVQQPYETELLAKYPEVDLIYVAHNTEKEVWKKYLVKHQPPATLQLYVPQKNKSEIKASAGTTGAPTYVMVDDVGKMICRPCPKPNDPLLGKMVEAALAGREIK